MIAWYFEVQPSPEQIVTTIRQRHRRRQRSMDSKRNRDQKR